MRCVNSTRQASKRPRPATPRPSRASRPNAAGASGPGRSERRDDLVQLAAELFAKKGYQATTVREIADTAGILSGSLYHHFDSKESIGDEILSSFLNDVLTDYRAAVTRRRAAGGGRRADQADAGPRTAPGRPRHPAERLELSARSSSGSAT